MKIAFIVGFYDPVRVALERLYPTDRYAERLIWIPCGNNSIVAFKGRFYEVAKTADGILVCLGRPHSKCYLDDHVAGIIAVSQEERNIAVSFQVFGNIFDATPVVEAVKAFGLQEPTGIGPQKVRKRVATGKILCVSLAGKTPVFSALRRAGFTEEAISECFVEEIIDGARFSDANEYFASKADSYTHFMYAWLGLRTTSPETKKAFKCGCEEAPTAADVVALFKKWILEGV